MISAAGIMKPLPVRPVDGSRTTGTPAPLPKPRPGRAAMQPLPFPERGQQHDLVYALRTAAHQRLMQPTGVQQPLPVVDPT